MLAFAACGGDDDGGAPSRTASSPTDAPTVPPGDVGPGVTDTQIRLGMTNDLTGVGMTPYAAISTAIQAYFFYVNAEEGGVCERELILEARDDQYRPEIALELAKEMITRSPILAMIGALNTAAHLPVAAVLNDPDADGDQSDGVPDLFVSTGWSRWGDTSSFPWTIGFIPDYQSDARAIARYVSEEFPDDAKIGLLYSDDEFGEDYRTGLSETFNEERMLAQPYPFDDTDVTDEVGALAAFGAQVLAIAAPPEITAQAIQVARAAEGDDPDFVLSYINQPSNLASDLGGGTTAEQIIEGFRLADGVVLTSYLLSAVEDEADPAVVEHIRIMETYEGPDPSSLSIYGQALAETVVETLNRACPDLTRENVLRAAESLQDFEPSLLLPGIEVSLSESDHRAIQALQFWRINGDGTLKKLGDPIDVGP
jgi:branched-chain amino acid transport system substrate-binding protein